MLIKYISDLHLEFRNTKQIDQILKVIGSGEVLILAGDLGNPYSNHYRTLLLYAMNNFEKVLCICGNHEYYNNNVNQTDKKFNELCVSYNIVNMNQNTIEYKGVRFIGVPLWSPVSRPCDLQCDTRYIKDLNNESRNELYKQHFKYIQDNIKTDKPTFIISHHLPSMSLIQEQYRTSENTTLIEWFASPTIESLDLTDTNIKGWIYGHTHSPFTKTVRNISTVHYFGMKKY